MIARSLSDIFDDWAGSIHPSQESIDLYGFELRVVVSKDIPPRHSTFSWIRGMGVTKFDDIFSGELDRLPEEWLIAFPERHCSIGEITRLIHQMVKLNKEKNLGLKKLDIITSSPFLWRSLRSLHSSSFKSGPITRSPLIIAERGMICLLSFISTMIFSPNQ